MKQAMDIFKKAAEGQKRTISNYLEYAALSFTCLIANRLLMMKSNEGNTLPLWTRS